MPTPAAILLVAALLPLASFGVLLFVGRRMGAPLAGWVGTAFAAGSFLCAVLALFQWYAAGDASGPAWGSDKAAAHLSVRWLPTGEPAGARSAGGPAAGPPGWLDVGLYVDSLTIAVSLMVTLVTVLVHLFSIGYMRGDARFARFFAFLSLFGFSMLGLVLSSTLVQLFVFWELVGFCSYLLIGFWFERRAAARAAFKAFVVNRVGDAALLAGFGLLFSVVGNASLPHLWAALGTAGLGGDVRPYGGGWSGGGAVVPAALMTTVGVLLFAGAAAKSAQFPLHAWLPDAMAGPTPVSALIHAATMVAAGVYLVGRLFPVLTPDAKLLIAIVGCVTLLFGALVAVAQTDIKQVLAYSTVSQLGYMMLGFGVGSWAGALFHLVTHGFFKALLFLGAGSVIHAARGEQDVRQFGGLGRPLPVTAGCFAIGVLAIAGAGAGRWGLSGYHSKSHLLTDAGAFAILATRGGGSAAYWLLFWVPAAVSVLTAFYMTRCWMLTFWGRPRNVFVYGRAREAPLLYLPLLGLAFMSLIAGYPVLTVRDLLDRSVRESSNTVAALSADAASSATETGTAPAAATRASHEFAGWSTAWRAIPPGARERATEAEPPDRPPPEAQVVHGQGHELEARWLPWAWPAGVLLGVLVYLRGFATADRIAAVRPVRWVYVWLANRMYVDALFDALFVAATTFMARLAGWVDEHVVDGAVRLSARTVRGLSRGAGWHEDNVVDGVVAGVGRVAWAIGAAARATQTGRVRAYVTALMLVVVIGLAVTVGVMMWG